MANATDFIATVYDSLARALNAAGMSPTMTLQMAWPGYSLSPTDFKAPDAPSGPYDIDVAREAFSALANIVPTDNRGTFENSGFEIDDLYELLLASAIPVVPAGSDPLSSPLNKLFSDAQFELAQAQRGYKNDPSRMYYPCTATPNNWYDEASLPTWSNVEVKSTDVRPADPASPFVKAGGSKLIDSGLLRLKPGTIDLPRLQTGLVDSLDRRRQIVAQGFGARARPVATTVATTLPPTLLTRAVPAGGQTVAASARFADPALPAVATATSADRVGARFAAAMRTRIMPANAFLQPDLKASAAAMTTAGAGFLLGSSAAPPLSVPLQNRLVLSDLIRKFWPTRPLTPATSGFSATFRFCKVNIDRPWFKLALLSSPSWRMFNTPARDYSTGTLDNNPGAFPMLPIAFIAIRDLRITANWSNDDRAGMVSAASFGFFDLKGGAFVQDTYEVKGLQIVALISRPTPPLPPLAG